MESKWEISKEEVGCEDGHVNNLINKDDLSNEIQRIYDEHYSESTSQAIHDIFNAVFKRINKAKTVNIPTKSIKEGRTTMINDKLDLISKANKFKVTKHGDNSYDIEFKFDATVAASIDKDNNIQYYVTNCYNSGIDWMEFDIEELHELREFIAFITS